MRKLIARKKAAAGYTLWVIIVLTIFGLAAISARLMLSEQFRVPGGDTIWTVNIAVQIPPASKNEPIQISPPWDTKHSRIIAQKLNHAGLRFVRGRSDDQQKRVIDLKVISEEISYLNAEFTTHLSVTPLLRVKQPSLPLSLEKRMEYLGSNDDIHVESPAVINTLKKISVSTEDKTKLAADIFEYVHSRIIKNTRPEKNDLDKALKLGHASTLVRAKIMVALSRAAGIPARIVSGFILEETFDAMLYYWVELYQDEGWVAYDPEKGYKDTLPNNFLPFNKGNAAIVISEKPVSISYDIEQHFDLEGFNLSTEKRFRDIFDLERFQISTRNTLAVILLLPFGALITTLIRTFLGIRSYGTFTPTLIALAAVYADWVIAVVLLTIVIALGMTGRTIIPGKLLRVPRLSIVFTIVAMSMAMGVSLMDYFDYSQGAHVVLLPIVILTTLIDRFYSAADEDGIKLAIRRLIWTIIIAMACYSVLRLDDLGHSLLAFPEIHFFTLALVLLVSLYKGKKVSDIPYFYWLAEPKKKKKKSPDETIDV